MKRNSMDFIITVVGCALLAAGLFLLKTLENPDTFLTTLPYVFIGIGCGIFGHGMGNLISRRAMKNAPERQRQLEIEKNDERNIAIANRAKARAHDMMTFLYGAEMVAFALMGVELRVILLLVFAYLFVQGYAIYCRFKYDKEM